MSVTFEAAIPAVDSGRLMMDLPPGVCDGMADVPMQKVSVTIGGKAYLCNLFRDNGRCALHVIRAIQRDIGLGQTVMITLAPVVSAKVFSDIHADVQSWETVECVDLMKRAGVRAGDRVVDFGCGYGHYAMALGIVVGESGRVYAVDKDNRALTWVRKRAEILGLRNIETVKTKGAPIVSLPDGSVDVFLLYDIIHSLDLATRQPLRFPLYREARRVLKPNGLLSILSFDSETRKIATATSARGKTKRAHLIDEIEMHGFQFSHDTEGGVHFDGYHSAHRMSRGVTFAELERGTIWAFAKE